MNRIDLNADVGEGTGGCARGDDRGLMESITSASIACGWHAGDPGVMRATVALARERGVRVGAHPGFPDLQGFGRRPMRMSAAEVEDLVVYQVGALAAIAAAQDVALQHVKPHGALYTMAAVDAGYAEAIVRAVAAVDRGLWLFAPPDSVLSAAGAQAGLHVLAEGFADRGYLADGTLVPRERDGAVLHDLGRVTDRALTLARDGAVEAIDGSRLALPVGTLCVHGDTPDAVRMAAAVRLALGRGGIRVLAPSDTVG